MNQKWKLLETETGSELTLKVEGKGNEFDKLIYEILELLRQSNNPYRHIKYDDLKLPDPVKGDNAFI